MDPTPTPETLLTLPPAMAAFLRTPAGAPLLGRLAESAGGPLFATSDPPSARLGSGGGTVNLLAEAWRSATGGKGLEAWLAAAPRLVLHAGGESRRLPAYAAEGKLLFPVPLLPGHDGQRLDQSLCDFQLPLYREALVEAGPGAAVLVTSGDVLLEFEPAELPVATADITGIGMRVPPEVARDFGVFFVRRGGRAAAGGNRELAFFLQKPAPEEIHRHLDSHEAFVDTGMWLLSARAVRFLFAACGFDPASGSFAGKDGLPLALDLYGGIGPVLGHNPAQPVPAALAAAGLGGLTVAVAPLERAAFHHLGSNRQVFESLAALARGVRPRRTWVAGGPGAWSEEPAAAGAAPVFLDACLGPAPRAAGWNLVSCLPEGAAPLDLPEGACVETAPALGGGLLLRVVQVDDTLRGGVGRGGLVAGQDAAAWLAARGLEAAQGTDVFDLPLYPVLAGPEALDQGWIDFFVGTRPDPARAAAWRSLRRVSARAWSDSIDFAARRAHRELALRRQASELVHTLATRAVPGALLHDGTALAAILASGGNALAGQLVAAAPAIRSNLLAPVERSRFELVLARVLAARGDAAGATHAAEAAFAIQREAIVASANVERVHPTRAVKEDQIVWARSPVRLDLAGGWSDTPPVCFEVGGAVVNVAVTLNGQPPVQVFVRPTVEPVLRIHSIDLGLTEELRTYADVDTFRDPRSGFSLAKAAYALAGFHPEFQGGPSAGTLADQLRVLGGGFEVSLLCAVPKGSGLGTSSILAATLLGALNRAAGLGWDTIDLYRRVLAMEQLLTTGGGWQDQAGALFPGLKLVETQPGIEQHPVVRMLPDVLDASGNRILLYYTGITRLAKGILQDIVTHLFLGRAETRRLIARIKGNARALHEAAQVGDARAIDRCVARSWRLNRRLDAGTTTPAIDALLASCGADLAAAKLLGAGGGGYLLMIARDPAAAARIRARLEADPPNARARFVDVEVAKQGLVVTVS